MKMKPSDQLLERAVELWCRALARPKFNNGDGSVAGFLAQHLQRENLSYDQAQVDYEYEGALPYVNGAFGYREPGENHYPLPDGRWLVTALSGRDMPHVVKAVLDGRLPELTVEGVAGEQS
jgi:hypothetical protein